MKPQSKKAALKRNREELEFLPAALEVLETPPRPAARMSAAVICLAFLSAIVWSVVGEIDTVATATGQIVTTERVKVIQPLENGIIRAIHVRDGTKVAAGDVLIEIDPTEAQANVEAIKSDLGKSRLDAAAASALLTDDAAANFVPVPGFEVVLLDATRSQMIGEFEKQRTAIASLDAEIEDLKSGLAQIDSQRERAKQSLPIIEEQLAVQEHLLTGGITRRPDMLNQRQKQIDVTSEISNAEANEIQTNAKVTARVRKREEMIATYRAGVLDRRTEALRKAASLDQQLTKEEKRRLDRQLKTPVDGTVFGLVVFTVGGVVTTKDVLMRIVPSGSKLEAEVTVQNKDIGFIDQGQPAEIKLETFPFTRYGLIAGTVKEVSRDAIQDEKQGLVYRAVVSLATERILVGSKWVPLTPGMSAQAEIKTGRRPVIDYFLSPFLRYRDESLRER